MAPAAFNLEGFVAEERQAIERARVHLTEELLADVPAVVAEPIRYALDAGGKRLRPLLCIAAYRAVRMHCAGGEEVVDAPEGLYAIASAIELIHTYSLVHDDLPCMDDDDLRRGRPTTHRAFGESAAIVAGAALIPLAAKAVRRGSASLGLDDSVSTRIVRDLMQAAGGGGMVGGQWLDLAAEGRSVTLAELEAVHRKKTGALLAAAPRLGGIAAGADERLVDALTTYGQRLGLAFQIADDVLDVTGSTTALGKTAGRDLELAKATYPAMLGVDGARRRAHDAANEAIEALRGAGLHAPALEALARYAVERDR